MINLYVKVSHQSIVVIAALLKIVVFIIGTWGQDSTTSLREVSSTWGQSDKSKYCKGIGFFYSDTRDKQTATKKYEGVPFTWIAK